MIAASAPCSMVFDFDAAVSAPFRMQPGLRRLAAGRAQLTPLTPGSRHQREKLAVLSAFWPQALLARAGFRRRARRWRRCAAQAAAEHPGAWGWDGESRRGAVARHRGARRRPDRADGARPLRPGRRGGALPARPAAGLAPGRPAEPGLCRGLRRGRRPRRHASPGWPWPCPATGRPRRRSAATSPRSTPRWPTANCCARPATR